MPTLPLTIECPLCRRQAERGATLELDNGTVFVCESCFEQLGHDEDKIRKRLEAKS